MELSPAATIALTRIIHTLNHHAVPYQITGALAGNLHGSRWPLQDIDIEVDADLARLAEWFPDCLVWGPGRYVDDEFSLDLLQLNIAGIPVDINSIHEVYLRPASSPVRFPTDLSRALDAEIAGLRVKVQPLEDLIHYKRLLQRSEDLADLENLSPPHSP